MATLQCSASSVPSMYQHRTMSILTCSGACKCRSTGRPRQFRGFPPGDLDRTLQMPHEELELRGGVAGVQIGKGVADGLVDVLASGERPEVDLDHHPPAVVL